jgi:hypothetical protein
VLCLALAACHQRPSIHSCSTPLPLAPRIVRDEAADPGQFIALILDAHSNQPLPQAELLVPALNRVAPADSLGVARLTGLPSGQHVVVVRHFGYREQRDSLVLHENQGRLRLYQLAQAILCE